jgi:hypothetical protein
VPFNGSTTTKPANLRMRWAAIHAPSTPTYEGATTFLNHFDAESIISTVRKIVTRATTTGDRNIDGALIRLRTQAALLAGCDHSARK